MNKSSQTIELRREEAASDTAKELYEETLFESHKTCDLVIKAGPQKVEYFCHRIILAASSEFLWKSLETTTKGKFPILFLPDVRPEIVKNLLKYVYTAKVRISNSMYAEFIDVCHLLQIKEPVKDAEPMDVEEINKNCEKSIETYENQKDAINSVNDDESRSASEIESCSFSDDSFDFERFRNMVNDSVNGDDSMKEADKQNDNAGACVSEINETSEIIETNDAGNASEERNSNRSNASTSHSESAFTENDDEESEVDTDWSSEDESSANLNTGNDDSDASIVSKEHDDQTIRFCKRGGKGKTRSKEHQMKLTSVADKKFHEQRLKLIVRLVYEKTDKKLDKKLETVLNDIKLVTEGDVVTHAEHTCGFCAKKIRINYSWHLKTRNNNWLNKNLRLHMENHHGFKYKAGHSKRNENTIEITSSIEKRDTLKRAKESIKGVYERIDKKLGKKLDATVNNTKLLFEGKTLLGTQHVCGFCNEKVKMTYKKRRTSGVTWESLNLRGHLEFRHNIKYKVPVTRKFEGNLIKVTSKNKSELEKRAKACVRRCYQRIDKKLDKTLEEIASKTTLKIKNNMLLRADHNCAFCNKSIFITYCYKGNRLQKDQWMNATLKNHLISHHNFKYKSLAVSILEPKNDAIKVTPKTKISLEKQAKDFVRRLYQRSHTNLRGERLEDIVNNTRLIVKNKKLYKAEHICWFCKKERYIQYTINKSGNTVWINSALQRHLYKHRDSKF